MKWRIYSEFKILPDLILCGYYMGTVPTNQFLLLLNIFFFFCGTVPVFPNLNFWSSFWHGIVPILKNGNDIPSPILKKLRIFYSLPDLQVSLLLVTQSHNWKMKLTFKGTVQQQLRGGGVENMLKRSVLLNCTYLPTGMGGCLSI